MFIKGANWMQVSSSKWSWFTRVWGGRGPHSKRVLYAFGSDSGAKIGKNLHICESGSWWWGQDLQKGTVGGGDSQYRGAVDGGGRQDRGN